MAFLLAYLQVPLSWGQILRRTFHEALKDNCLGMAAQLAYYFFFALFPTLLVMIAIADVFAADVLKMIGGLGGVVPSAALTLVTDQLGKLTEGEQGGLMTIGMLTALWSSSAAMTAIIDTLNTAYDIEEGRPWWRVRLTAIALTIGLALFIVVAFALVVAGPTLAERLADRLFLGAAFEWTWKILQWPLVFALVSAGIAVVYYFAPDAEQDWVWLTPGSIMATTLWLVASLGFKFYLANVGGYESYGIIGGVMVLMLWFYLSGLVILIGAEMNAEIEHASAYGKDVGEKVPGEKRTIGPALQRVWEARHRQRGGTPPSADEVKAKVKERPAPVPPGRPATVTAFRSGAQIRRSAGEGAWADWIIGAPVVLMQALWTLKSYRNRIKS
jgi:membrane protein